MFYKNHKKFFSKIGFNYLFLIFFIIISQTILGIILSFYPYLFNDNNLIIIISATCTYILPLPIFIYLMNKLDKDNISKKNLTLFQFLIAISICFASMYIGNLLGIFTTDAISQFLGKNIANPVEGMINNNSILINILIFSILAPIFEEILFRKLLIDRTIQYGGLVSILLSAFIFALFHGNLNQFFYTFFLGLFFAYVYLKTGKIIYPIILHSIINFTGSTLALFFTESLNKITNNIFHFSGDHLFVLTYILLYFSLVAIGLISLIFYRKDFKLPQGSVKLETPFKTIFLNLGMISFVFYQLIQIYFSIVAI